MPDVRPVRGTRDFLPDDSRLRQRIEATALRMAELYGFGEIATPIFEFTEVFARTLGEASDIVAKEMYTFADRGGESLTLRPEGTAAVVRAFISNGLAQQIPLKLFYRGPMFRYERPQKGRLRQFHQIGVEVLGAAGPLADAETIALGHHILDALGVAGKVVLEINSLGDAESRAAYRDVLVAYFSAHREKLSPDSVVRLERNPLRILDSKDEGDRAIIAGAPELRDSFNDASRQFFDDLLALLTAVGVPYRVNSRLVRGLDYYCHTAFEFVTDALGAQGTVMAGGRYDGLVAEMGGPSTPGIGWAAGVERLMMLLEGTEAPARPIALIPVEAEQTGIALATARQLRDAGFTVDIGFAGGMGKRMKRADKLNARAAVILGETEVASGSATVRDLDQGTQAAVAFADLGAYLGGLS